MRLIRYEFTEGDERLSSHSGLALIGALLNRTRLKERLSETILPYCREPKISHADIIYAATGLMCLGKPDYDAILTVISACCLNCSEVPLRRV